MSDTYDDSSTERGHVDALERAREALAKCDLERQCRQCGAELVSDASGAAIVRLRFLDDDYEVRFPDLEIRSRSSGKEPPVKYRLLIMHYIAQAQGAPLSGEQITFREIPDGQFWIGSFYDRVQKPLLTALGHDPDALIERAAPLGGRRVEHGDVAVKIDAFSKVSVVLLIWKGDDELPPESNVLLDSSITSYLTSEDIAVLCDVVVERLAER